MNEKIKELINKIKADIDFDEIKDVLMLLNPLFEFENYYKYVFNYKNKKYGITAYNFGDRDDIYRMEVGRNVSFKKLFDEGFSFDYDGELIVGDGE